MTLISSQIPSPLLLQLQRFKQRFEVAFAEGLASFSADDFEKEGWAVLEGFGEELQ